MIIDDERIILNGLHMMIEDDLELPFSTDIVTASNVPKAIEFLNYFTPDLILTDIRMPVMDGFELIRHVREELPAVNIVILTSHADFEYAQKSDPLSGHRLYPKAGFRRNPEENTRGGLFQKAGKGTVCPALSLAGAA